MIMASKSYIHVIMPIGSDPNSQARKNAILAGIERAGFIARFPTYELNDPKFSLEDLKRELRNAHLIIADLSLERPSCYYELGVAEALGKKALLFATERTPLHQSAARGNVGYYSGLDELSELIYRDLSRRENSTPRLVAEAIGKR